MNTDLGFLVSLVESEVLGDAANLSLGDSALLEVCFNVAAYAVPLPAETNRPGPPSDFLKVAREAFQNVNSKRSGTPTSPDIDEAIVGLVHVSDDPSDATLLDSVPPRVPPSAYWVGESEWSWSPHHERWDRWYISKNSNRRAWVLWVVTPNWREWGFDRKDMAVAIIPAKGIDRRTAALHLLVALLRRDASEYNLDSFHSITPGRILSFDDFDQIAEAVWGDDEGEDAGPLIDKNTMNDVIIGAWRERVGSLSTS